MTERLAAASARRPRRTLTVWGIVVVVALVLVATCLKGLTGSAHVVGTTESSQAKALYAQVIGGAVHRRPTDVIVVSSREATARDSTFQAFVTRLLVPVRNSRGVTSVSTDLSPGSPYVSADHHAVLIGLRAASDGDIKPVVKAVQAANGRDGFTVAVTGSHTVGNDFTTQSSRDLQHGELAFGLPIALVILVLVFGAVVAGLMPVLMALLSIVVGLGIAALISREFSLSIFIVNMMTGMGLALGIDYSLFVISRFREERGRGLDKEAAIRMAGATASRAVLFSGSTFVIALLGMFLVPTNILRSLAAGAVIVGVVSVAAALTLLPAMLSLIGDRVNSLRLPVVGKNLGRTDASEARVWRAVIGTVMRHRVIYLVLAGGVMIAAAAPVLGLHIGQSGVNTLPDNLPSKQGYLAVQRYFPSQDPYPVDVVAVGAAPRVRADLSTLEAVLSRDPRFGPGVIQSAPGGRVLALTAPIRGDAVSSQDVAAVLDLRQHLIPAAFAGSGSAVYVGGQTAETADYFHAVTKPTPYVLLFVLGLSFVLLMLAFRSLVIAAVSILLNLLSVGAAYGILTLVFLHGVGAGIFGFHQVSAIDAWVPLFLFSVLFALSMDYQVFLMSRIKERYDQSGSTHEAVAGGVASTARIITGAALIIVAVFSGFARGQLVQFQQMGFGVAVALLLDATVIRTVVLPSILSLLDQRSWCLPHWLDWLPHIEVEAPQTRRTVDTVSVEVPGAAA
ncbi:MAG TPA: MMPL family transporter [Acidimicrobiales bacterium]|nr:MMPL family transporter [Acidimicrobiales bacterium]